MKEPLALDRIGIDGIELLVFIGAFAAERRIAQIVVVDVEASVEMAGARHHDRLDRTLDYAALHLQLLQIAQAKPYALLEHLGQALLAEIVAHPAVLWAQISLRKPQILRGATPCVVLQGRRLTRVAIGLGANLGAAQRTLGAAVKGLEDFGQCLAVSALYRSLPWGVSKQPAFLNAAALIATTLLPQALLAGLKRLERDLGRVPGPRWGPRAIDLDLLDDGGPRVWDAELTLPHPRMYERAFVLVPLAEIAPEYNVALECLPEEARTGVVKLAEWPTWCANLPAS